MEQVEYRKAVENIPNYFILESITPGNVIGALDSYQNAKKTSLL